MPKSNHPKTKHRNNNLPRNTTLAALKGLRKAQTGLEKQATEINMKRLKEKLKRKAEIEKQLELKRKAEVERQIEIKRKTEIKRIAKLTIILEAVQIYVSLDQPSSLESVSRRAAARLDWLGSPCEQYELGVKKMFSGEVKSGKKCIEQAAARGFEEAIKFLELLNSPSVKIHPAEQFEKNHVLSSNSQLWGKLTPEELKQITSELDTVVEQRLSNFFQESKLATDIWHKPKFLELKSVVKDTKPNDIEDEQQYHRNKLRRCGLIF